MRPGFVALLFFASLAHAEVPEKKVLAFYYTWYGNPETSGAWIHWTEGGHNPDKLLPTGLPDTGTTNHPLLGLYDSMDPGLMRNHLALAEEAGIDIFIATWWGQGDRHDQAFAKLLDVAKETGVKLTVYYETVPENSPEQARNDLEYIVRRYADHPAFFRYDGAPVIFVYGRAMNQILRSDWEKIAGEMREKNVSLMADSRKPVEGFLGSHVYNPVGAIVSGLDMGVFYREDAAAAREENQVYAATIIPGYDDSNIGRATPIVADRKGGELYEEEWRDALSADPDWIVTTSWNELHEGSEIEPTHEDGRQYLAATARWTKAFKSGRYMTVSLDGERVAAGDSAEMTVRTSAPGTLALEVGSGENDLKAVRMQGTKSASLWRLEVPPSAVPGRLEVPVRGTLDGQALPDARVEIEVVPPITCDLEAVVIDPDSGRPAIAVRVRNNRGRQNTALVTIEAAPFKRSLARRTTLGPEESRSILVPIPAANLDPFLHNGRKPWVRVDVSERANGTPASDAGRLPVAIAVRAKGPVNCDGSLDEWNGVPASLLDESMYMNRGTDEDTDPISARAMTMWDEDYFYLAVEADDRVHHQTLEGFYVWKEDNLQAAFDPFMDGGDAYRDDDREFGFTLTPKGPEVWRWTPPLEPGDESLKTVRFGAKREGTKTIYEAAIPWDLISPIMVPRAGKSFGFSLALNNASPDRPTGALQMSDGIIFSKTPSSFPRWTLVETE